MRFAITQKLSLSQRRSFFHSRFPSFKIIDNILDERNAFVKSTNEITLFCKEQKNNKIN